MNKKQILIDLFCAYGVEDERRFKIYLKYLSKYPEQYLQEAIDNIVPNNKFLPKISEIVKEVKNVLPQISERDIKREIKRIRTS